MSVLPGTGSIQCWMTDWCDYELEVDQTDWLSDTISLDGVGTLTTFWATLLRL